MPRFSAASLVVSRLLPTDVPHPMHLSRVSPLSNVASSPLTVYNVQSVRETLLDAANGTTDGAAATGNVSGTISSNDTQSVAPATSTADGMNITLPEKKPIGAIVALMSTLGSLVR